VNKSKKTDKKTIFQTVENVGVGSGSGEASKLKVGSRIGIETTPVHNTALNNKNMQLHLLLVLTFDFETLLYKAVNPGSTE
jgi:hypothetical protein